MRRVLLLVASALCLAGCATVQQRNMRPRQSVAKMAAFDLSCPKSKLVFTDLGKTDAGYVNRLGVTGCGKKTTYVPRTHLVGSAWVRDSEVLSSAASAGTK